MHRFDIVLLSDFRFSGGTASAMAEEIRAAHAAGYSIGLVALEAANLTTPLPLNPRLRLLKLPHQSLLQSANPNLPMSAFLIRQSPC